MALEFSVCPYINISLIDAQQITAAEPIHRIMLQLAIRPMPVSYHVINRSKGTELPEGKTMNIIYYAHEIYFM